MPRNRSVANNFEFSEDFLKNLPPSNVINSLQKPSVVPNNFIWGNPTQLYKHAYDVPSSSEYDNISDFDIISFGRSSASSISWNDDFDLEGTQNVKNELERLDRVLQGVEHIPSNYNRDEIELWMKTFPHLSLYEPIDEQRLEICDKVLTSPQNKQFAVIKDILQKVPAKTTKLNHSTNEIAQQFDNILRISPVLLGQPAGRSFYLDTSQSSHSVYKSAKSASKWMRQDHSEYTLLPYLTSTKSDKLKTNKTACLGKEKGPSKLSLNKNFISLPPIKATTMPSAAHYRSVSATLSKVCNEQSIQSAHVDCLKRRKKVPQGRLDSIQNILNYTT